MIADPLDHFGLRAWPFPPLAESTPVLPQGWPPLMVAIVNQARTAPGTVIQLTGARGQGKTTLRHLLTRLHGATLAIIDLSATEPEAAALRVATWLEQDQAATLADGPRPALIVLDDAGRVAPGLRAGLIAAVADQAERHRRALAEAREPPAQPVSLLLLTSPAPAAALRRGPRVTALPILGETPPLDGADALPPDALQLELPALEEADCARLIVRWLARVAVVPSRVAGLIPAGTVLTLTHASRGNPGQLAHLTEMALKLAFLERAERLLPRHVPIDQASAPAAGRAAAAGPRRRAAAMVAGAALVSAALVLAWRAWPA